MRRDPLLEVVVGANCMTFCTQVRVLVPAAAGAALPVMLCLWGKWQVASLHV